MFYAPGVCKVYFTISVSTIGSLMSLALIGDESNIDNPQDFIECFKRKNNEILEAGV